MKTKQETYEIGDSATVTRKGYMHKNRTGKVVKVNARLVYLKFSDSANIWPFYREDLTKEETE